MHVHMHIPACHSAMDEVHTHTLKGGGRAGKERGVLYGGGVMT